jgi:hypothetical protein
MRRVTKKSEGSQPTHINKIRGALKKMGKQSNACPLNYKYG